MQVRRGRSRERSRGAGAEGDQRRLEDGVKFLMKQGGLQGQGWGKAWSEARDFSDSLWF